MQHDTNKDYYLIYLRVNGCYFWFNILQLVVSVIMIFTLYLEDYSIAALLEIIIAFLVALDL